MKTNGKNLKSIQETLLDDFSYIVEETRQLSNNTMLDFERGVLLHNYFNKATAPALEADIRLLLPELEKLQKKLEDLSATVDEFYENISDYVGDK